MSFPARERAQNLVWAGEPGTAPQYWSSLSAGPGLHSVKSRRSRRGACGRGSGALAKGVIRSRQEAPQHVARGELSPHCTLRCSDVGTTLVYHSF